MSSGVKIVGLPVRVLFHNPTPFHFGFSLSMCPHKATIAKSSYLSRRCLWSRNIEQIAPNNFSNELGIDSNLLEGRK